MANATMTPMAPTKPDAATLRDFLHECAASAPVEEADRVREALRLLPPPPGGRRPESRKIEALLENGAAVCAVLAILGPRARFLLSRGEGDCCLATVLAHDGYEEMVSEGPTLALALLSAHVAACLVGLERRPGPAEVPAVPLAPARLH